MEHHAPHPGAVFEGYYSKFALPSGAHLALVVCKVHGAKVKPNMVSFTYVPQNTNDAIFQKEVWADNIEMIPTPNRHRGFVLQVPGMGYVKWDGETTEYKLEHADFSLQAHSISRTPWSPRMSTPESFLVYLPLPLHWHVHSLASVCRFQLNIPKYSLPAEDHSGRAIVHDEKNWANSFPSAHMWLQARDGDRSSFCCAGGKILGMEAFLLGYRSKNLSVDFRPPFALRFAGLGPFMSYRTDWESRRFEMSIQSFRSKLTVKASAPKGSFFSLSSPFPEGHRENYLGQSFQATIEIAIYESGWLSPWRLIRKDRFDGASLEFGAGYYPPAGSEQRYH